MNWTKDQGLSSRFKVWKEKDDWILKVTFKEKNEGFKAKTIGIWAGHQGRSLIYQYLSPEKGPSSKDCMFKESKDYWTCFTFTINLLVNYYTARDEFFRCNQGIQSVEEYLTQLQRLTHLVDYPNDSITMNQLLLDKMVTGLNDAHLRKKLYKEAKGLTMEKALHIIRIYAAKHIAQGMTVNYLKGKGKNQRQSPDQQQQEVRFLRGQAPVPRQGWVWEMWKRNPLARTEMPSSWSGISILQEKGHYEVVCRKKKSTVHQVSAEPSMATMTVYTSEDGTLPTMSAWLALSVLSSHRWLIKMMMQHQKISSYHCP